MQKKKVFLMAVGGSGGHIYPALAVSESLQKIQQRMGHKKLKNPSPQTKDQTKDQTGGELEIHFIHSGSSAGRAILASSPYPVHEIPIGGLARGQSFLQKIKTCLQLPIAFARAFYLILQLKPCLVFGTGGAVCAPVVLSAFLLLKKIALWEGNAIAGLSNRWLSYFADCVFVVFSGLEGIKPSKQILCAYPLRKWHTASKPSSFIQKLRPKASDKKAKAFPTAGKRLLSLGSATFSVLILGGSQGSLFLNQVVIDALKEEGWRKGCVFFHQTGQKGFSLLTEEYKSLKSLEVFPFSPNLKEYYERADIIFSRAGSGAIWEAAFYGKPLVLIPLSRSAGGHQLKNAQRLLADGCVELITEQDFNPSSFKKSLLELKEDKKRRMSLALNLKKAFERSAKEQTKRHKGKTFDPGSYQIAQKLISL